MQTRQRSYSRERQIKWNLSPGGAFRKQPIIYTSSMYINQAKTKHHHAKQTKKTAENLNRENLAVQPRENIFNKKYASSLPVCCNLMLLLFEVGVSSPDFRDLSLSPSPSGQTHGHGCFCCWTAAVACSWRYIPVHGPAQRAAYLYVCCVKDML